MKQVLWIAMVPLLVAALLVLLALTCGCGPLVNVEVHQQQYQGSNTALLGPDVMEVSDEMAPGK